MPDKLYQNDVGHQFTVRTFTDFTSVNTVTLEVRQPQQVGSATWIGTISETTSGDFTYTIQSGDLANAGVYELQAKAWVSATNFQHGETFNIVVLPRWK
jgi:hypothetical protein